SFSSLKLDARSDRRLRFVLAPGSREVRAERVSFQGFRGADCSNFEPMATRANGLKSGGTNGPGIDSKPSDILLAVVKVPPLIGYVKYKAQQVVFALEVPLLHKGKTLEAVEISILLWKSRNRPIRHRKERPQSMQFFGEECHFGCRGEPWRVPDPLQACNRRESAQI
ncbi:MAG TPA: hypothetical protein VK593_00095, partial [Edaphobacter sp.]|nr:hypothetical protein [Edaphobacter sp.]